MLGFVARVTLLTWFIICAVPIFAQDWQTSRNNPGNISFVSLPYPVVFVASKIVEAPNTQGGITGSYHIGTDIISANNPDAGNHLWIYLPGGTVTKLFPLPSHQSVSGLIDTPAGQLDKGSVVEPNISEDGKKVYFSYFHDATNETPGSYLSKKGADLYWIDLGPIIENPLLNPATLSIKRLTTRIYDSQGYQHINDRLKDAMNTSLSYGPGNNNWGTVYMHAEEMRTAQGLKLVYVSDERRIHNSNQSMSAGNDANHNFSLMIADIEPDGSLGSKKQFQYYTTTSALSPNRIGGAKGGIAFSYQATEGDARHWEIQGIDSNGKWYPIIGYGANPEAYHLSTYCLKTKGTSPGEYLVAARYYNTNNEGFGNLWRQDLTKVGVNTYDDDTSWGILPRQTGSAMISQGIISNDYPSDYNDGIAEGKITTPRCGRPDELLFAYSPTSANGRLYDEDGNKDYYRSLIAYRPNLDNFNPMHSPNPTTETGLFKLVEDSSQTYNLVWPSPVISWQERTGEVEQSYVNSSIVDPDTTIEPGMPFAQVGTSALWNTDRRPFDCWLGPNGSTPFTPNQGNINKNQEKDLIVANTDGLTIVQDQSDFCKYLLPQNVLGVAVNLTSNRTNMSQGYSPGYETDHGAQHELTKLIGVYDVRNQSDQSFMAVIPANAPFELKLLDRKYGLKLVDVRSWHSLQPRETRNDCGGCHQHEEGAGIPFENTHAASNPPLDMVNQTTYIDYDANCNPVALPSTNAALSNPEWKADIWPLFDQKCGTCHNTAQSSNPSAQAIFGYSNESEAYSVMLSRNFANSNLGALGSPAFWAARGERTDGRNNNLAIYQPNVSSGQWGFRFSTIHDTALNLCNGTDLAAAQWVYKLGTWIDNYSPRDTGNSVYGSKYDYYHPVVASALTTEDCAPTNLRIGFWDDTGILKSVQLTVNGVSRLLLNNQSNGSTTFSLNGINTNDKIEVIALDNSNNRQKYETTVGHLVEECALELDGGNGGGGSPGIMPSPSPSVSPSPNQPSLDDLMKKLKKLNAKIKKLKGKVSFFGKKLKITKKLKQTKAEKKVVKDQIKALSS